MKIFLTLSVLFFMSSLAHGAQIKKGSFNPETKKVELSVTYGGGCSQHFFALELMDGCRESSPVQCDLELVHTSDKPDFCEMMINENLELDLPEGMLTDPYYESAFITIMGSGETSVHFQLQ